jgi:ketosteroid isomerase-like protein
MRRITFIMAMAWLAACTGSDRGEVIQEIRKVEQAFNDYLAENGIKAAFVEFAADQAVINRNDNIIKGRDSIAAYFDTWTYSEISLTWQPEFIDVSGSGDMAYTYGPYQFNAVDQNGVKLQVEGIFHTVWKKQQDGSWKYVYD